MNNNNNKFDIEIIRLRDLFLFSMKSTKLLLTREDSQQLKLIPDHQQLMNLCSFKKTMDSVNEFD